MSIERLRDLLRTGALLKMPLPGLALLALCESDPGAAMEAFQEDTKDLDRQLAFCAELFALRPQDPGLGRRIQELGFKPWDLLLHGTGEDGTTNSALQDFGLDPSNVFMSKRLVTLRNLGPGAPRSIHVNKSLRLSRTGLDQWYPRDLRVRDDLYLSECQGSLRVETLSVGGRLDLWPDLTLEADQFQAKNVSRRFSDEFDVRFTPRADLRGWRQNHFDPSIVDLKGKVGYGGFRVPEAILDLPWGRETSFDGWALPATVTCLPAAEWRDRHLSFLGWEHVETIPEDWTWPMGLEIFGFHKLQELPKGLHFHDGLTLYHCKALTHLPHGLRVGRSLKLVELPNLHTLPEDLRLDGDLEIRCVDLNALPEHLHVPGSLMISGDSCRLSRLPEGLRVGGDLELYYLPNLNEIPEGIEVGGRVKFHRHLLW